MYQTSRIVADDESVGLKIWYDGSGGTCQIKVLAAGDIVSLVAAATDTVFGSAAAGKYIDVSSATWNTFGEILDHINGLEHYKAILVDVLRSDSADASTGTLKAVAYAPVGPDGIALKVDTSKASNLSVGVTWQDKDQDDSKRANILESITSSNTFSSTNTFYAYECIDSDPTKTPKLLDQWAGGATGTEQSIPTGLVGTLNLAAQAGRLLVRMKSTAACTGRLGVNAKSMFLADYVEKGV